jgi:hypothetical protein
MADKTHDDVVEELLNDPLFMDTFALMTQKFPEVDNSHIGELLVVGVLYEKGMIIRGDNEQ